MRALGFNFTKISVEKLKELKEIKENIKINTGIDILDLKEVEEHILKTKDDLIEAKFVYKINYIPEYAKLEFEGRIIIATDQKITKNIIKEWKKKKLPEEFRILLFNIILKKISLRALSLEEELNLPLHIPMPSFRKETQK